MHAELHEEDMADYIYAIPDITAISLRLCGLHFPDAVPFHITKMEQSPSLLAGVSTFELACVPQAFFTVNNRNVENGAIPRCRK